MTDKIIGYIGLFRNIALNEIYFQTPETNFYIAAGTDSYFDAYNLDNIRSILNYGNCKLYTEEEAKQWASYQIHNCSNYRDCIFIAFVTMNGRIGWHTK